MIANLERAQRNALWFLDFTGLHRSSEPRKRAAERRAALADYIETAENISRAQAQRARRLARAIETGDLSKLSAPQRAAIKGFDDRGGVLRMASSKPDGPSSKLGGSDGPG